MYKKYYFLEEADRRNYYFCNLLFHEVSGYGRNNEAHLKCGLVQKYQEISSTDPT